MDGMISFVDKLTKKLENGSTEEPEIYVALVSSKQKTNLKLTIASIFIKVVREIHLMAGLLPRAEIPHIVLILNRDFCPPTKLRRLVDVQRNCLATDRTFLTRKRVTEVFEDPFTNLQPFWVNADQTISNLYGPWHETFDVNPYTHDAKVDHHAIKNSLVQICENETRRFPDFQNMMRALLGCKHCAKCLFLLLKAMNTERKANFLLCHLLDGIEVPVDNNDAKEGWVWRNDDDSTCVPQLWREWTKDQKKRNEAAKRKSQKRKAADDCFALSDAEEPAKSEQPNVIEIDISSSSSDSKMLTLRQKEDYVENRMSVYDLSDRKTASSSIEDITQDLPETTISLPNMISKSESTNKAFRRYENAKKKAEKSRNGKKSRSQAKLRVQMLQDAVSQSDSKESVQVDGPDDFTYIPSKYEQQKCMLAMGDADENYTDPILPRKSRAVEVKNASGQVEPAVVSSDSVTFIEFAGSQPFSQETCDESRNLNKTQPVNQSDDDEDEILDVVGECDLNEIRLSCRKSEENMLDSHRAKIAAIRLTASYDSGSDSGIGNSPYEYGLAPPGFEVAVPNSPSNPPSPVQNDVVLPSPEENNALKEIKKRKRSLADADSPRVMDFSGDAPEAGPSKAPKMVDVIKTEERVKPSSTKSSSIPDKDCITID